MAQKLLFFYPLDRYIKELLFVYSLDKKFSEAFQKMVEEYSGYDIYYIIPNDFEENRMLRKGRDVRIPISEYMIGKKYPRAEDVLNQIPTSSEEIFLGGFHTEDCIKDFFEKSRHLIKIRIDRRMTDDFFYFLKIFLKSNKDLTSEYILQIMATKNFKEFSLGS